MKNFFFFCLLSSLFSYDVIHKIDNPTLDRIYSYYCHQPVSECDIGEHMPILRLLASECSSVVELGVGPVISTWGLLKGLSESKKEHLSYFGVDIADPPKDLMQHAETLANQLQIDFQFLKKNDLELDLKPVDLLFIDSLHTYCHLMYELETFSPKVRRYIALHDTSAPWGHQDDNEYSGDRSEYPAHFNREKRGLWPAVLDFLEQHPEWILLERRTNCHGFTVLKRISP